MADIIRQLRYIQEKYKNDIVSTGRKHNDLARLRKRNERLQAKTADLKIGRQQCDDCACEIANER